MNILSQILFWQDSFIGCKLQASSMGPQFFSPFPVEYPIYCPCSSAGCFQCHPQKSRCTDKVKKSKWIPSCRSVFSPHWQGQTFTFFRFFRPMHFASRAELKYFHDPLYEPELIDWGDRWFEVVTEGGQGVPCGEWRKDMSWMRGDNVVMGRWRRRQGRETSQCRRWLLRSLRGKLRKLYTVQGPALAVGVLEYPGGIFQDTQALGPYHKWTFLLRICPPV